MAHSSPKATLESKEYSELPDNASEVDFFGATLTDLGGSSSCNEYQSLQLINRDQIPNWVNITKDELSAIAHDSKTLIALTIMLQYHSGCSFMSAHGGYLGKWQTEAAIDSLVRVSMLPSSDTHNSARILIMVNWVRGNATRNRLYNLLSKHSRKSEFPGDKLTRKDYKDRITKVFSGAFFNKTTTPSSGSAAASSTEAEAN